MQYWHNQGALIQYHITPVQSHPVINHTKDLTKKEGPRYKERPRVQDPWFVIAGFLKKFLTARTIYLGAGHVPRKFIIRNSEVSQALSPTTMCGRTGTRVLEH